MRRGILILAALVLVLGLGLALQPAARAGAPAQAAATPSAAGGAGGLATAPANIPGQDPNEAVGFFAPICLGAGLIFAAIGAIVATRSDAARARRIRGRDAPHLR